jgi:hypothetical protein
MTKAMAKAPIQPPASRGRWPVARSWVVAWAKTGRVNFWKSSLAAEWPGRPSPRATTERTARTQSGPVMTGDDSWACSAAWVRAFPRKVRT